MPPVYESGKYHVSAADNAVPINDYLSSIYTAKKKNEIARSEEWYLNDIVSAKSVLETINKICSLIILYTVS